MALTNCPECKKEISSTAAACPHCGHKEKKAWLTIVIGAIILTLLILMVTGYTPTKKEQQVKSNLNEKSSELIENCWNEYGQESDETQKYKTLTVCEHLEREGKKEVLEDANRAINEANQTIN